MGNSKTVMTVSDLMAYLQISNKQVYLMIDKGMPFLSIGQHKRFLEEEVIAWMRTQANKTTDGRVESAERIRCNES